MAGDGFVGWLKTLNSFKDSSKRQKDINNNQTMEISGVFNQIDNRN
jgi:hypothetical protein